MEKISNIATAATEAIWGKPRSSSEEPVSGKMGDVSAGEPYDAGNIETPSSALPRSDAIVEEMSRPRTESAGNISDDDTNDNYTTAPLTKTSEPTTTNTSTAPTSKPKTTTDTNPAHQKPSSATPRDMTTSQADTRDPSEPTTHPKAEHERHNVDDTTGGMDVSDNPTKVEGPGPRPLEELAKEHGGDAGAIEKPHASGGGLLGEEVLGEEVLGEEVGERRDSGVSSVSSIESAGKDRKSTSSSIEGTGVLHVRSSGFSADGGDFDASRPGAGREADRLLEKKGLHRDEKGIPGAADDHHGHHRKGSKGSLKERIKAKLHHKDKSNGSAGHA